MSILKKLSSIIEKSQEEYEAYLNNEEDIEFVVKESIGIEDGKFTSQLVLGDNIKWMRHLLKNKSMKEKIQFIYIDPPFYSKADYKINIKKKSDKIKIPVIEQIAYKDTWENGMEDYLSMLCTRLFFMKDLLKEDGSIFVHLDWHCVHYVKVLMDEIFGQDHFNNEIIWSYKSGGVSTRYFARKHDTILFYSKSDQYFFNPLKEKSYNRGLKPYRFKGVKEYQDEIGWYTMVNMKDVWQMDMVGRTSKERVGYATQKPEALIENMILACTQEGDICADFFGGSGTLAATASKLNRKWLMCDMGKIACMTAHKRLASGENTYQFISTENEDENTYFEYGFTTEKNKIKIKLGNYNYKNTEDIPCHPKYKETILEVLKQDALQFIEYWSVDAAYDENDFKPTWHSVRTDKGLETEVVLESDDLAGKIAVRVLDIFGNETFVVKPRLFTETA